MKAENSSTRPLCIGCNRYWAASKGRNGFNGVMKYRRYCNLCRKNLYQRFKKDHCEECGFVPEIPSQLDVDHTDGDHMNNDPSNLRTLCANCHRLKTALAEDWKQNYKHKGVTKIITNESAKADDDFDEFFTFANSKNGSIPFDRDGAE